MYTYIKEEPKENKTEEIINILLSLWNLAEIDTRCYQLKRDYRRSIEYEIWDERAVWEEDCVEDN